MAEEQEASRPILEPIDWWWQGAGSVHDGILAGMKGLNAGNESALQARGFGSTIFGSVFLGSSIFIGGATKGFNGAVKNGVAGTFSLYGAELGFAIGSSIGPAGSAIGAVAGALGAFGGGVVLNYLGAAAYDGGLVITSAGGRGDELPPDLLYWQSLGPQEPGTLLIGSMTVPPISAPDIRPFWQNIPVGATPVGTLSIGESAVDQPVPYLEQYLQYLNTEPQRSNLEWSGPPIVPAQGNNPVEGPQIIERGEPPIIGKQSNNPGWGGQPLVGTQGNNLEWSGPPNISTRGSNLEWSGPPSITAPGGNMEWSGPPADVFSTGTKPIGYIDLGTLQPAIPSPPNLSPAASSGPAKSELPLYLGERSFAPSVEVVCRTFCTGHRLHNGADEFFWHAR